MVTNNLSYAYAAKTMQIQNCDTVIIFDRLKLKQDIVKRKKCKTFYFINSDADVKTNHLSPGQCIVNYTTAIDAIKYRIPPMPVLGSLDTRKRISALVQVPWIKEILSDTFAHV